MQITVVALGKIGLPLAVQYATKGHRVIGADVDRRVVELVNAGTEPFPGESHLAERLADVVERGLLTATTDTTAAVAQSDAVVIVVPLFVDDEARPDFALDGRRDGCRGGRTAAGHACFVRDHPAGRHHTHAVSSGAGEGERPEGRARTSSSCFSPERVLTGRVFADLRRYPKLIGGVDDASARRAQEFYEAVLDFDERPDLARPNGVWDLGSAEASELAKLAETTYRDVNIGLANQFALFAGRHGIDVHQVIEASNSQPYSHIHQPGIAVGGHCIPVYPRLYLWNDPDATVVSAARAANAAMPSLAVELLAEQLGDLRGLRVAVLGAAYRGAVKETAFSGVFAVVEALRARGATPMVHDPMYDDDELTTLGFAPYHLGEPVDAAVIQADHAEYATLSPEDLPGVRALLDGRNVTDSAPWQGVTRVTIGQPTRPPLD